MNRFNRFLKLFINRTDSRKGVELPSLVWRACVENARMLLRNSTYTIIYLPGNIKHIHISNCEFIPSVFLSQSRFIMDIDLVA